MLIKTNISVYTKKWPCSKVNRSPEALKVQIPPDCKRLPGAPDARKRPAKCASAHEQAADKADGVPGERLPQKTLNRAYALQVR